MNKPLPLRAIYNLVLIIIVVISVVAIGLISVKGYRVNKILEMYSDKKIINQVQQKYLDFEFGENDNWNIDKYFGEGNKSFTADVSITQIKELCKKYYKVQLLYKLANGKWNSEEIPDEITLVEKEWLFEDSIWSLSTDDGIFYEVSFLSDLKAEMRIEGMANLTSYADVSDEALDEAVLNDENVTYETDMNDGTMGMEYDVEYDTVSDDKELVQTSSCYLSENEDGESFEGIFEVSEMKGISLIITENFVKLVPEKEEGELILKRE